MPSTTTDRLNGLTTSLAVKAPCLVATTGAITLSGEQTIDGVVVVSGNRVLVKDQASGINNGIYVAATGVWTRATDFDGSLDAVGGTQVFVATGTSNGNTHWRVSGTATVTIAVDSVTFEAAFSALSSTLAYEVGAVGDVTRDVQSRLRDFVSAFDFIPTNLHAAIKAHTSTTDVSAYLEAASDHIESLDGGDLYMPPGTYIVGRQTFAGATGLGYSYLAHPIIDIRNCTRPVRIIGHGAVLKAASGLKYGSFDPTTGASAGTSTDNDFAANGLQFIVGVDNASFVVEGLEIDGNESGYTLGGLWGDQGRQIQSYGVIVLGCDNVAIRDCYIHHHPLDGIAIGYEGITIASPRRPHTLTNVRSEYNCRQGLSWVGGNCLTAISCSFSHTGKGTFSSSPAGGVDVEAESAVCRNGLFLNCEFINNSGEGFLSDSGDSANITLIRCKLVGSTNHSAWPRKPGIRFIDCQFYGKMVNAFPSSADPGQATQFIRCLFSGKVSESPTGTLFDIAADYMVEISSGTNILFDGCVFDTEGHATALLGSTTGDCIIRNCRFIQDGAGTGLIKGRFEGRNEVTTAGTNDISGSTVPGTYVLAGAVVGVYSAITAASQAHALNATFSDTEVESALNALGTKINSLITVLEADGRLVLN